MLPLNSMQNSPDELPAGPRSRVRQCVMILMAVLILVPSLLGFGTKFVEFIRLVRGDVDGTFAITPVVNYLLASSGFLCLFIWAALGGMFHDIERPKRTMLQNEDRLNARSREERSPSGEVR
ncbi:MAG: hypothetical protein K8T91_02890 [Planctomycetes bacterium]|nr:hypothetical protein [Planctomycetota bacterium]